MKILIKYHGLLDSIITNQGLLFISKFGFFFCYYFNIKCQLSIAFYLYINEQIKR